MGTFGIKPTFDLSLSFDQQIATDMEDQMAKVEHISSKPQEGLENYYSGDFGAKQEKN